MKQRRTATERLADVFQVLQLARKSGLLTVERDSSDEGPTEGIVKILNGKIVDASAGPYRGNQALDVLRSWGSCYFTFQASSSLNSSLPDTPPGGAQDNNESRTAASSRGSAPHRLHQVDDALPDFRRMGLSRTHRQLFLLIDGQRTLQELARLTARSLPEVDASLSDLERAGLIQK